jgi:type II secretory pathway component HofQ
MHAILPPARGALLALALVAALLPATPAGAERRVAVYRAEHRVAEELLGVARTGMAGHGSVALDRGTNSLVLVGEPGAVAATLELLGSQDRGLRTVVLRYRAVQVRDLEEQGFDVRWTASAGDFRLGNVRVSRGSGSSVDMRAHGAMQHLADSFTGTVRVTEGASTRIETGTSVPLSTAPGTGRGARSLEFVTAATGFEAGARVLGDGRVQVDHASFAGRLGRRGTIETTNASVPVIVTPGETIAVAGLGGTSQTSRESAVRGGQSEERRDETVLLLRADLE